MKSPIPVPKAEQQPGEQGNGPNPLLLPLLDPDANITQTCLQRSPTFSRVSDSNLANSETENSTYFCNL